MYGGCCGTGTIEGDITVTFTGSGSNLHFKEEAGTGVCGDNSGNGRGVKSGYTSTLVFESFDGNFGAEIVKKFDTIEFKKGSEVSTEVKNLADVKTWNFDADFSLNWIDAQNNNFAGDTLNFGDGGSYTEDVTFFVADNEYAVEGFDSLSKVTIFGVEADAYDEDINGYAAGDYQLVLNTDGDTWSLAVEYVVA